MSRILLIEDDTSTQLLYKNRLTDLGHEVVVSGNGAQGLFEARSAPFDLFLVDIGLGAGIDGYEVCWRLKKMPELHAVPVVLISGHVKLSELHKGYEAGCQAFLLKGDLTLLEDVVRSNLHTKRLLDELALQVRIVDDQNRRLEAERSRNADLTEALSAHTSGVRNPSRPDGLLLVDGEGVVVACDRGARDLLGGLLEGKHLAVLAPDSRLEAIVRDTRSEPHEGIRFEVPERAGRPSRALVASVFPFVPPSEARRRGQCLVQLFETSRSRPGAEGAPALHAAPERSELGPLLELARDIYRPSALLGDSPAVRDLRARIQSALASEKGVLLEGPPGCGKAFVARILHYASPRTGIFVEADCGTVGAGELEQQLFGEPGALASAHRGTLFLRGVDRMPPLVQKRLLEALDGNRAAASTPAAVERVDVRLVASSRSALEALVEKGRFERELFERLTPLSVPGLAERAADIEALCNHFLQRFGSVAGTRLTPEALWVLGRHAWPENVRELEQTLRVAADSVSGPEIGVNDLSHPFTELHHRLTLAGEGPTQSTTTTKTDLVEDMVSEIQAALPAHSILDAYELAALKYALRLSGGDKLAAAKLLGVGKSTFYRKLKQHGIS